MDVGARLMSRRSSPGAVYLTIAVGVQLMVATTYALFLSNAHGRSGEDLIMGLFVLMPPTLVVSLITTWLLIRKERKSAEASNKTLLGGAFGGIVVVLSLSLGFTFLSVGPPEFTLMLFVSVVASLLLGAPFGFLGGIICIWPIRAGCARPEAIESRRRAVRESWNWLAFLSLGLGGFLGLVLVAVERRQTNIAVLLAVLGALSIVSALIVYREDRLRDRLQTWLGSVAAGEQPGWSIVPYNRAALGDEQEIPVFFDDWSWPLESVLVREKTRLDSGGAYRSSEAYEPVALVPSVE